MPNDDGIGIAIAEFEVVRLGETEQISFNLVIVLFLVFLVNTQ